MSTFICDIKDYASFFHSDYSKFLHQKSTTFYKVSDNYVIITF